MTRQLTSAEFLHNVNNTQSHAKTLIRAVLDTPHKDVRTWHVLHAAREAGLGVVEIQPKTGLNTHNTVLVFPDLSMMVFDRDGRRLPPRFDTSWNQHWVPLCDIKRLKDDGVWIGEGLLLEEPLDGPKGLPDITKGVVLKNKNEEATVPVPFRPALVHEKDFALLLDATLSLFQDPPFDLLKDERIPRQQNWTEEDEEGIENTLVTLFATLKLDLDQIDVTIESESSIHQAHSLVWVHDDRLSQEERAELTSTLAKLLDVVLDVKRFRGELHEIIDSVPDGRCVRMDNVTVSNQIVFEGAWFRGDEQQANHHDILIMHKRLQPLLDDHPDWVRVLDRHKHRNAS